MLNQNYKVIGTRPIRHDALDKVTGRAVYGDDIQLPGQLYGRILRSPHPHARIKSIDMSGVLALKGVRSVVTSADMPQIKGSVADLEGALINYRFLSNNCLAAEKVLYVGQAVAAVAASTPEVAEHALSLIKADYEILKPVFNAREAMQKDAPILHENLTTMDTPWVRAGGIGDAGSDSKETNIANQFQFQIGDVVKGFEEADVVVEQECHTVPVHQGYIEPHAATVLWNADGSLIIWTSSQGHFLVREQTARVLGIPESKIKVIPLEIGGGFGGKLVVYLEPVAALLSRKSGRPVKMLMNRTEVFVGTGPTSGTNVRIKIGGKSDGHITAAEAYLLYDAGAFPGSPVGTASQCIFGQYDIPNIFVEGIDVVVNLPKAAAYRAPGVPACTYAVETAIDDLCEKLNMDPLELRLLNSSREGTRQALGPKFGRIGSSETLLEARQHEHYTAPLQGPHRGRGVASAFYSNASGPATAIAIINSDATVNLLEGSPDIGGSRTVVAMQLAESLGIPSEDVRPSVVDTDAIGYTSQTGGSAVAFKTGIAAYEAAEDIKKQLIERAATIWATASSEVVYEMGCLRHQTDSELTFTFSEIARKLNSTGGPVVGRATVNPKGVGGTFSTHIVDVEVDIDTGKIYILRYTAIQDAGKAIHPTYVEGQIQGGVAQGIGWALNEEYVFNSEGRMMNANFLDYRMPISLDLPMIDIVVVEVANPGHPFGVRGVGEMPIVPPIAAIANAVYRAVGVRINQLPMSPERVLAALSAKSETETY